VRYLCSFGSLLCWLVVISPANAQSPSSTELVLASDRFSESFEGKAAVPVSGNLIVGLHLGPPDGNFAPQNVRVALRTKPISEHLCLSLSSRDGRYSARNLYKAAAASGLASFAIKSAFQRDISHYANAAMAVLIRDVADCRSPDFGVLLPSRSNADASNELRLAINAPPERTTVSLMREGSEVARADCRGDSLQVSMAFAAVCHIKAPAPFAGAYVLRVNIRERFEPVVREFALRIDNL